jgi:hypothetical protein
MERWVECGIETTDGKRGLVEKSSIEKNSLGTYGIEGFVPCLEIEEPEIDEPEQPDKKKACDKDPLRTCTEEPITQRKEE